MHMGPANADTDHWLAGYRLVSSNANKLAEYRALGLPLELAPGVDLPEVDGSPEQVVLHKSKAAGPGTVIEDTVLWIGGAPVVDVRWRLEELAALEGARVTFVVNLALNDGAHVMVWSGRVDGHLRSPESMPADAFGFDPFLIPDGAGGLSLHDLVLCGRKELFSARARAAYALLHEDAELMTALADIVEWTGGWQGNSSHP